MLKTTATLPIATAFAIWSGAANADAFDDKIIANLRELGYDYIEIERGATRLKVEAIRGAEELEVLYDLDYGDATPIGRQVYGFSLNTDGFVEQIAPARTFVLREEADAMRQAGLGVHLTYQDVLVFGEDGPIDNALRFLFGK